MRKLPRSIFQVNQKIEIFSPESGKSYSTSILDVTGNAIYVSLPTDGGVPVIPPKGSVVEGRIAREDAFYTFSLTMLGVKSEGGVPMLIFDKPTKVLRHQRRTFYRCPAVLDMEYTESKRGISWRKAKTLDIGGGGVRFMTDEVLSKGTELIIKIYIAPGKDEKNVITLCGEVVRSGKHGARNVYRRRSSANASEEKQVRSGKHGARNVYSVKFTDISEAEQDRLINFAFSLMRKRIF